MAVVMKNYRIYKCVKCAKKAKTERAFEGYQFGNPFFRCPHCGALNYDPYIKEPALLSTDKLLKNVRAEANTLLLLLYMPCGLFAFWAVALAVESFLGAFLTVGLLLAVLTYLILKRKKNIDISVYQKELNESMERLNASTEYAQAVIQLQGLDEDSFYKKNTRVNML